MTGLYPTRVRVDMCTRPGLYCEPILFSVVECGYTRLISSNVAELDELHVEDEGGARWDRADALVAVRVLWRDTRDELASRLHSHREAFPARDDLKREHKQHESVRWTQLSSTQKKE